MTDFVARVVGIKPVSVRLGGMSARVRKSVFGAVKELGATLQRRVKEELTGQVLNVRTNRLRSSITLQTEEAPDHITARVGTNVKYGRYHELGFHGAEKVRAHDRYTSTVFGHRLRYLALQHVGDHDREVNYGGRPFLRPALEERRDLVRTRIQQAIGDGIRGG